MQWVQQTTSWMRTAGCYKFTSEDDTIAEPSLPENRFEVENPVFFSCSFTENFQRIYHIVVSFTHIIWVQLHHFIFLPEMCPIQQLFQGWWRVVAAFRQGWSRKIVIPKFSMYGILNIYLCIHLPQIYKLNVDKHCIHGAFGIYLLNVLTVNYWSNLPSPIGFGYFDTHWSQEKMQFLWHQFKPYKTFCFFALRG